MDFSNSPLEKKHKHDGGKMPSITIPIYRIYGIEINIGKTPLQHGYGITLTKIEPELYQFLIMIGNKYIELLIGWL